MAHENATPRPWRTTKTQPNVICNEGGNHWIARATIGKGSPRFIQDAGIAAANAALIVEAVNAYDTLRAENERLRKVAHDLTDAITKVRPLGGSELFRRFDDQTYFADAAYCGAAIEEMKRELHEARKDAVRAKRHDALSEAQP